MKINVSTSIDNTSGERRVFFGPFNSENDLSKPGGVKGYKGLKAFFKVLFFKAVIVQDTHGHNRYLDKKDLRSWIWSHSKENKLPMKTAIEKICGDFIPGDKNPTPETPKPVPTPGKSVPAPKPVPTPKPAPVDITPAPAPLNPAPSPVQVSPAPTPVPTPGPTTATVSVSPRKTTPPPVQTQPQPVKTEIPGVASANKPIKFSKEDLVNLYKARIPKETLGEGHYAETAHQNLLKEIENLTPSVLDFLNQQINILDECINEAIQKDHLSVVQDIKKGAFKLKQKAPKYWQISLLLWPLDKSTGVQLITDPSQPELPVSLGACTYIFMSYLLDRFKNEILGINPGRGESHTFSRKDRQGREIREETILITEFLYLKGLESSPIKDTIPDAHRHILTPEGTFKTF